MRDDSTSIDQMPEGFGDICKRGDKRPVFEYIDFGVVVQS